MGGLINGFGTWSGYVLWFIFMSSAHAKDCSEALRQSLLDLLGWTLLVVRNYSTNSKLCFIYADHAHNIPGSLPSSSLTC